MNYSDHDASKVYLYPCTLFASHEQCEVVTILGSCISVCLFDEQHRVGGINHYMLPFWNGQELASPKYGNIAIEQLLASMLEKGASKHTLIAKVFGGANQLESTALVGEKNIRSPLSC